MFDHMTDVVGLGAGETRTQHESRRLPDDLEHITPGPELATLLAGFDRTSLSGYDTVRLLQARNRQLSHEQAQLLADMVEISHRCDAEMGRVDETFAYASDEIRAALHKTRRAAEADLEFATALVERLPAVWDALSAGSIDTPRARVIVQGLAHLPAPAAVEIADQTLNAAPTLTTGQLRARLQRICLEANPTDAVERYRHRHAERRVESSSNPEGTANLHGLDLAPQLVSAIRGRIEREARHLRNAGDRRTMDQLRADVYTDLLMGRHHKGRGPGSGVITMTAPIESLAGLSELSGDIPGLGPVIADIARQVLGDETDAEIRFRIDTPDGPVIGTPSRRATRALRRHVETRDETCVAPGCRMPATECDLDHRRPWSEGGKTNDANTEPLCRHDHVVRHRAGWALVRNPDGSYTWTTRLGHTYTTRHPP